MADTGTVKAETISIRAKEALKQSFETLAFVAKSLKIMPDSNKTEGVANPQMELLDEILNDLGVLIDNNHRLNNILREVFNKLG